MNKIPIILFWSGGKDCSYTLNELLLKEEYDVRYLLSTINGNFRRLSMHGIREEIIEQQAKSVGIPLKKVYVYDGNNKEYELAIETVIREFKAQGINTVAFGDIFLEDLREYREMKMKELEMNCLFPIWKKNTRSLVEEFINKGFISHTCCVNDGYLSREWVGRKIDYQFLKELPLSVDPCGENGEFHTFCSDGPIFKTPISFQIGEIIYKPLAVELENSLTKGFWYCDFLN